MATSLQTQQLLTPTKQQKYDFFKNGSSSQGNPYAKYDFFANTQQNTSAAPTQKYDFFSRLEQKKAGTLSQTLPQTSPSQNEGWGKDYLDLLQNTYMKLTSDLASGGARMLGKGAAALGMEKTAQNLKDTANGVQLKYQDWLKQNPDKIARDTSDDNWLQKGLYGLSGALTYTLPIMALNFVPGVGTALSASAMYLTAEENLREDLVESGASEEQADKLAMIGGGIIGALDYVSGGTIMKPIKKMFQKNLSSALVKSGLANTIKTIGKSMVMEGSTEALQQVVQNAFVKTVDENRSMMKDVGENALYGGIMGGMFGGLHAGYNNSLSNKKEAKIEQQARDYVEGNNSEALLKRMSENSEVNAGMKKRFIENMKNVKRVEKTGNFEKNQYNNDQELLVEGKTKYATPAYQLDKNTYSSNFFAKQDKQGLYVETKNGKIYSYTGPEPFTNANTFSLDKNTRKYRTNFDNFIKNKDNATIVGITKLGKNITLTDSVFEHIIKDHGIFDPNSLIATIAKPDNTRRELQGQKRPYFLKKTLSSNHYLLLGLKPSNDGKSYKITSFYERYDNKSQRLYTSQTDDITSREAVFQQESDRKYGVGDPAQKEIAGELGKEQIKALAKKYGIEVEIVEAILTPEGKKAYGQYHNKLITLAKDIKEGTASHELLHAVFGMIDTDTRTFLLSEIMKEEGISASQAEEKLADMFSNYFLTGKVGKAPKSTRGKIKQFFKKVARFIKGYAKSYQAIEQLFDDVVGSENIGELNQRISENSALQEGRARMKKRFLSRMKEIKEIWEMEIAKVKEETKEEEKALTYKDLGWSSKEYDEYLSEKLGLTEKDFLEAKLEEKTGNSEKNQYTSNQESSPSLGGKTTNEVSPRLKATFAFNKNKTNIGGRWFNHIRNNDSFKTNYTFTIKSSLQKYVDNFNKEITRGGNAIIGTYNGRNVIMRFNNNFITHFLKHGGFAPENLVSVINTTTPQPGRKRTLIFQKQLPNGKWLRAIVSKNLNEISFYETKSKYSATKGKNIQPGGKYQLVYHGTPYTFETLDLSKGDIGIHFGSKQIAQQAGINKASDEYVSGKTATIVNPRVLEVDIDFKNPLRMKDIRDFHDIKKLSNELVRIGVIEQSIANLAIEKNSFAILRNAILNEGYDGIVYKNIYETKGKGTEDSYIVLDIDNLQPKNVKYQELPNTDKEEGNNDIYSASFKKWFGDWENNPENASKVVDAEGKPLPVVHTTKEEFTTFDKSKIGARRTYYGEGFYFALGKSNSTEFGDITITAYINVRNPYYAKESEINKIDTKQLKKKGYDGILVGAMDNKEYRGYAREYVVFEPNQIKSTTKNNGAYDANSDDIRYQTMDELEAQERENTKDIGAFDSSIFVDENENGLSKILKEEKETQEELNKQAKEIMNTTVKKNKKDIFKENVEKAAIKKAKQLASDKKLLEEAERNIKIQKIGKLTKEQQKRLNEKYKTDTEAFFAEQERKRQERYEQKKEVKIEYVKEDSSAKVIMDGTKIGKRQSFKEWIKGSPLKDLLQPISTRVKNISKEVYKELMAYEQRVTQKGNARLEEVKPFIEVLIKIRKESPTVYTNLWLDLVNGNVGKANELLKQYGTSIPRKVLDEIWQDSEDVGYTMNYEGFYYPRKVENPQEFIEMIFKSENPAVVSAIEERIRQLEEKNGALTAEQKAQAINEMLLEGEVEGVKLGSGHMKNRKIDHVTAAMLKYYQDPVASLNSYIVGMTEAIEKARFLGRSQSGKIRTLGQAIEKQGIKGKDADTLLELLQDRMNYQGTSKFLQSMKDIGNIIHLGSPSSALTQLGDLSFSVIENGFGNVVKAIINRSQFDLKKMGIQSLGEEFASLAKNETLLQKTQRNVFKLTGFQFMDSFGKNVYLNSTWNRWMKYAKKNDPQLRKDISRRFEDTETIDQVMQDIKAGKMTENVNLLLFMKLANIQPLTRSQMPAVYLNSPNGRILYAFKTFGIKQLDYLVQETKRNFQENPTPQALLKVAQIMMTIILLGASVDEIKDFSMGRKSNSWIRRLIEGNEVGWDQVGGRFWENILKLTGLTRYSIYQAKSEGLGTVVEDLFLSIPGIDIVKYPTNDISKVFTKDGLDWSQAETRQMLPIIGKYGYWWLGKGQTKQQDTLDKENKTSNSRSRSSSRSRSR